jgi:two-component system nitrogen regulation sensor histidine kinase GlnL
MKKPKNPPLTPSYEDILESLSDGVVVVDREMKTLVFNQAAEKMTEVSRTLVLGKPASGVFSRNGRIAEILGETIASGRLYSEYELELLRRFSGPLPIGVTTSQVFGPDGTLTGAAAIIKDRSGLKSLEEGNLRKERLAYIGTFAANLAHEIKNPLSGMRGAAQLFARKVTDEKLTEYTRIIIKEADRLDRILHDMLDFTRPSTLVKKDLNIHMVLDSVVFLLKEGLPTDTIVKEYDPSLPEISGDEGQLTQVFLNLMKNAKEAIVEGGRVRVITKVITDFHLVEPGSPGGMMAAVEIRDDGCGIKEADIENIFTPFFTTKAGGSGLGMAISLKIIKEHNGFLRIDSRTGEGTTVTVYLPLARGA